jgi:hypothetical protein
MRYIPRPRPRPRLLSSPSRRCDCRCAVPWSLQPFSVQALPTTSYRNALNIRFFTRHPLTQQMLHVSRRKLAWRHPTFSTRSGTDQLVAAHQLHHVTWWLSGKGSWPTYDTILAEKPHGINTFGTGLYAQQRSGAPSAQGPSFRGSV